MFDFDDVAKTDFVIYSIFDSDVMRDNSSPATLTESRLETS